MELPQFILEPCSLQLTFIIPTENERSWVLLEDLSKEKRVNKTWKHAKRGEKAGVYIAVINMKE